MKYPMKRHNLTLMTPEMTLKVKGQIGIPLTLNLNICRYDLWWMPTFNIKCPPKYIYPDWQANY